MRNSEVTVDFTNDKTPVTEMNQIDIYMNNPLSKAFDDIIYCLYKDVSMDLEWV